MNTEFIQQEYPYVFNNEFNSRVVIGEIPKGAVIGKNVLDIRGDVVQTSSVLLTKDKSGVKEWVVFFKVTKGYGYSFLNSDATYELNKIFLNYKINKKQPQ